ITHRLSGSTLTIVLPRETHAKVMTAGYQSQVLPNARLAGLFTRTDLDKEHPLVPLIFREIRFPKAPAGKTPSLQARIPQANWVFTYDERRAVGYLLIRPRATDID